MITDTAAVCQIHRKCQSGFFLLVQNCTVIHPECQISVSVSCVMKHSHNHILSRQC